MASGFAPDANGPMAETFGIVLETAASTGLSRASEVKGHDTMVMHGNRGGNWGEWTDPAKRAQQTPCKCALKRTT
jgi:hypothetical protein